MTLTYVTLFSPFSVHPALPLALRDALLRFRPPTRFVLAHRDPRIHPQPLSTRGHPQQPEAEAGPTQLVHLGTRRLGLLSLQLHVPSYVVVHARR